MKKKLKNEKEYFHFVFYGAEGIKRFSDAQKTWVSLREQTCELQTYGIGEPEVVKGMCEAEYNEARYKELSFYYDSIKED